MVTTIIPPTLDAGGTITYAPAPQGTAYKYDRLNRLKQAKAWQNLNTVNNVWESGLAYFGMYENNFSYDANGNITAQMRKDATGTAINDLTYNRRNVGGKTVQNRLYHVNDAVLNTTFTDDIDDQGIFTSNETVNTANNYGYDEIGNLNRNNQKEIAEMVYTVTGKVKEVHRTAGSNKENLKFDYDANGNRIAKHVYTSDDVWMKSDYYVNDAQGNNMAIYTLTGSSGAGLSYQLAERNVYGSSRVGTNKTPVEMIGVIPQTDYTHTLGDKNYFLSNHLGNNLVTVTDRKLPVDDGNGMIAFYMPHVISTSDFYPFGVTIKERTFAAQHTRYQFNGKEYDSETETTYMDARNLDSDLGIMETRDPKARKYTSQSPYNAFNNNPIIYNDPTGEGGELVITGENTATLVINVILYSDVVDDIKLQQLQTATQEYAKKHLGGSKELKTKSGKEVGQNEKTLSVTIQVNVQVKSFDEVVGDKGLAATNKSVANNFIYVGNTTNLDGSGEIGGHQEGNAGYVSSETRGSIVLHEVLSSLEIYKSSEEGKFVDNLHGHNEEQNFSLLASPFLEYNKETKKYAGFTGKDLEALEKKGITTPISSIPTPIGTLSNQTYKSGGGTKIEATPSPK